MGSDDDREPGETSLADRVDPALQLDDDAHEHVWVLDAPVIVWAFRQHLSDLLKGRANLP